MKNLVMLLTLILSINATRAQEAITLNKNDPAPFHGTLIPDEQLKGIRKDLVELDNIKLVNESLNKSIFLYKENNALLESKNTLLLNRNDELAKTNQDARNVSSIERFVYFTLGATIIGVLAYGYTKSIGK